METTTGRSRSARRVSVSTIALVDQPRRAGLLGAAARLARDRCGPPAVVRVVAGGSLAGNDSSIASSSRRSSAARRSLGFFFAWSFISVAPRRLTESPRLSRRRILPRGLDPYRAEGERMRGGGASATEPIDGARRRQSATWSLRHSHKSNSRYCSLSSAGPLKFSFCAKRGKENPSLREGKSKPWGREIQALGKENPSQGKQNPSSFLSANRAFPKGCAGL